MALTRQAVVGTFIHSKTKAELEYAHETVLLIDENGIIAKKGPAKDLSALIASLGWDESSVSVTRSPPGGFFFPGFIDTHIHASQYPNAGIFGKSTLLSWLEKYTFPLESSLKDLARARRVYTACVKRTLAHGTTTAAYYATIDVDATNLLAKLCFDLGQRALVGRVCMDRPGICPDYYRDESAEEGLQNTKACIEYIQQLKGNGDDALVRPILTPRFAPSCTSDSMRELGALAREKDLRVQTHISENKGEIELVKELFPGYEDYTDVYDKHDLLTPRTILAHGIHLSEREARAIAARQSKVAHCPCSNSSLSSGTARIRWLWRHGVDVGLGTDVSGGYSPSVLEAARQAALVSRHVCMGTQDEEDKLSVEEVLYLATRGGAKCVGLEGKVGAFEEGMAWDAQLVRLRNVPEGEEEEEEAGDAGNVDLFGWEDWEEKMAKWVYSGDDRNTDRVWVRGRLVHARG